MAHLGPNKWNNPLPTMKEVIKDSISDLLKSSCFALNTIFAISGSFTTSRVSEPHQYTKRFPAHNNHPVTRVTKKSAYMWLGTNSIKWSIPLSWHGSGTLLYEVCPFCIQLEWVPKKRCARIYDNYDNYSILGLIRSTVGGVDEHHLLSSGIFTLITNKICMWAPEIIS